MIAYWPRILQKEHTNQSINGEHKLQEQRNQTQKATSHLSTYMHFVYALAIVDVAMNRTVNLSD